MKAPFNTFLTLIVIFFLIGISAALICTHCEGKTDECNAEKGTNITCAEETPPPPTTTVKVTAVTTASTEAESEGTTEATAEPEGLIERSGGVTFKCLTVTGKEKKDGDSLVWRGCGANGCKDDKRKKFAEDDKCEECEKDGCNSSVQIKPLRWILLFIATLCAGLKY